MAFSHGSKATFKLDNSAGALQDLTLYITTIKMPEEIDKAETTVLNKTSRTFIPGLIGHTISVEGKFDPTLDAHMDGIKGLIGTFNYAPAGGPVGATKPMYSGECLLTSYEIDTDTEDTAGWSAEFQITDDVARNVA
ncbi:MAG: hypothetical protein M0Z94_16425 [Dehalococcoidales bacterium]|nr:hypothetical protein [Dehalococcoidales bacterium]